MCFKWCTALWHKRNTILVVCAKRQMALQIKSDRWARIKTFSIPKQSYYSLFCWPLATRSIYVRIYGEFRTLSLFRFRKKVLPHPSCNGRVKKVAFDFAYCWFHARPERILIFSSRTPLALSPFINWPTVSPKRQTTIHFEETEWWCRTVRKV